jgi:hypothetical protein
MHSTYRLSNKRARTGRKYFYSFKIEIYTIDLDLKCLEPNRETQIGNEDKVVDKLLKVKLE